MPAPPPPPRRRPGLLLAAGVAAAVAAVVVSGVVLESNGNGGGSTHSVDTQSSPSPATSTTPPPPATSTTPPPPAPPAPPPAAGPPAKPAPSREQFGISVNRLFNDRAYSPAQIDAQLAALQRTGATVARSDALWEAAEPRAGHGYDWSFDDQIAASLAAHGLQWLPILDYSPSWAESVPGQEHSAPRDPSAFAAWAAALAARYGAGGAFWREHPRLTPRPVDTYEVWNEPDNRAFWKPKPDARYYVDFYLRTRDAIAAVDPAARVIVGGLTNPASFLPALFRARPDLAGHLDGVAIHPYGANPFVVFERIRGARRVLDSLGSGALPLYVTEFGWTTHPPGALSYIPERTRPDFISATVAALGHTDCGLAMTVLYTWVTPQRDPADHEDWFGIEPPAGGASPDVAAFSAGLAKAAAPGPTVPLCPG